MRQTIIGVSEIVLSVDDIAAMREFYTSVMGFPLHSEACWTSEDAPNPDGEPTISFLKIADVDTPLGREKHPQMLVLIDWKRHVFARKRFEGHEVNLSTLNHLAFEILPESYDSELERIVALGLDPVDSEFPDVSAKAIFFKDPEGNVLELICHATKP